jgi:hypothetical protein
MPDRKASDTNPPPANPERRRAPERAPGLHNGPVQPTAKTPKSSANAAIPPDKLNAENDK